MPMFPRVTGDGSGYSLPGGRWFELPSGIGFNRWDSRQGGSECVFISNTEGHKDTLEKYAEGEWNTVSFNGVVPSYATVVRVHIFLVITHDESSGVFNVITDFRSSGADELPLGYEAQSVTMFTGDGRRSMVTTPVILDGQQEALFYWEAIYSREGDRPSFAINCTVDTYYFDPDDIPDV